MNPGRKWSKSGTGILAEQRKLGDCPGCVTACVWERAQDECGTTEQDAVFSFTFSIVVFGGFLCLFSLCMKNKPKLGDSVLVVPV